jgi:hypothetical protein
VLTHVQPANGGRGQPVVVCGAGAAGLAAAVAAARRNAEVLLIESAQNLGGTVANALIHTIGGLFDSAGELVNDGLPRELTERLQAADPRARRRKMGRVFVFQACPIIYRQTVERWIADEPPITSLLGAAVCGIRVTDGQISELTVKVGDEQRFVRPRAVVDATGTGAVARMIRSAWILDDDERAGGGLIFRLRNVAAGALEFPKGVGLVKAIRAAADAGALPKPCRHAWLDVGLAADEAYVKLLVPSTRGPVSTSEPSDDFEGALTMQSEVVAFLKQLPGFQNAIVAQTGRLGIRDGGRVAGRYTLSGDDVRAGRKFLDGVCRGAWPIEYWDATRGVSIEYLPEGTAYEIPMRCLQLPGVENYWAAGKCLSADGMAHASARVAGTCWAMGQAVGVAAAMWRQEEKVETHEPLQLVSRNRTAAAEPPGGDGHEARGRAFVSRTR